MSQPTPVPRTRAETERCQIPAAFEEQHRAELTAYRAAAAYFKANNITKLPSPNKLEAEYCALASEKAKFYEQYKEAKEELLKLKNRKAECCVFFREEEQTQHHEIKECAYDQPENRPGVPESDPAADGR